MEVFGCGIVPAALFSDKPMHDPVFEPEQGIPSTAGSMPALPGCEFVIDPGCSD